ncbi:MAG: nitroreductase family protein [Candidatus Ornithospirochaeta sp.]
MDTIDAIRNRRSTRSFLDEDIDDADLMTVLEAGMTGPSACNRRPWEFIVVKSRETMEKIRTGNLAARPLSSAPVLIVVAADTTKAIRRAPLYWTEDAAAATENMLLAATDLGLGSLWMGVWPEEEKMERLSSVLNLPEHVVPFSMVALGYSADEGESMWKKCGVEGERIHREVW